MIQTQEVLCDRMNEVDQIVDCYPSLSEEERQVFSCAAATMFSLGYKIKPDKSKTPGYTFIHPRVKKYVLRFSIQKSQPLLRMKFFATREYSDFFHQAVRAVIEEYDYRYTGCYGCGKCDGSQGYTYRYSDGRTYYRCGCELIEITDIKNIPVAEMCSLLEKQHAFFLADPYPTGQ